MHIVFPILCHLKKEVTKFIPKNKEQMSLIRNLVSSLNKTQLCEKHRVFYSRSTVFHSSGVWSEFPASEQASRAVPRCGQREKHHA